MTGIPYAKILVVVKLGISDAERWSRLELPPVCKISVTTKYRFLLLAGKKNNARFSLPINYIIFPAFFRPLSCPIFLSFSINRFDVGTIEFIRGNGSFFRSLFNLMTEKTRAASFEPSIFLDIHQHYI